MSGRTRQGRSSRRKDGRRPASSGRREVGHSAYNQPPPRGGLEGGGRMRGRLLGIVSASSPVIVALAAIFTMAVPATGAVGPTNINTSAALGNEAEDALAVTPTNHSNIVTMATLPGVVSGLFEGVSFDGGTTWTRQVIGTGEPLGKICCGQQLAWDRFGNRVS